MPLVCNSRNTNASIGELGQALLETGTEGSTTGSNAQCASSAWPSVITAKPPQTTAMRLAKRRQIKLATTKLKDAKKPMPRPHSDKRKGHEVSENGISGLNMVSGGTAFFPNRSL